MKKLLLVVGLLAFASPCFAASGTVKWEPPKKFSSSEDITNGVVKGPKGSPVKFSSETYARKK